MVLGIWLFDQNIDTWTWVGAAVIFAAGIYIARREMMAGRKNLSLSAVPRSLSDT